MNSSRNLSISLRPWRCLAFLLLLALSSAAQYIDYRSVEGTVTFRDGEPARGAVVQIQNTRTLHIRSYVTKRDGQYHFESLSPDIDYELRASYHGKFGKTRTLSKFSSRKQSKIDLTIGE